MNAPTPRVAHACFWSGGEGALDGDGANLDDDNASLDGDGASLDCASLDGGGALATTTPAPRVAHACFWSGGGGAGALDGEGASLDGGGCSLSLAHFKRPCLQPSRAGPRGIAL